MFIRQSLLKRRYDLELVTIYHDKDAQAWGLCRIAYNLAQVEAWKSRLVDPDRRVPILLWEAVRLSLALDVKAADAALAIQHESLRELADETIRDIMRERVTVDQIGTNFMTILKTAKAIDERREHEAQARQLQAKKRLEERELRQRLTGRSDPVSRAFLDDHADESAGLAAQAASISALIAASDRLLRDDGAS